MRRIRPTIEGWIFLATSMAVALAALNTGNNLLYLVFAAMLSLVTMSGVLSEASIRGVVARRRLHEAPFAGRPTRGSWRVENGKRWLPHLALEMSEAPSSEADLELAAVAHLTWLRAGAHVDLDGSWIFERRGRHRLAGVRVTTSWPFGILRKWYDLPGSLEVIVYPRPTEGSPGRAVAGRREEAPAAGPGGRGDLHALRPWRQGEDRRLIHWRTSARRDRDLMIEREREASGRVEVRVEDPGAGPDRNEAFERSLSEATWAVVRGLDSGRQVRLVLPGGALPVANSRAEGDALLRALALAQLPGDSA